MPTLQNVRKKKKDHAEVVGVSMGGFLTLEVALEGFCAVNG